MFCHKCGAQLPDEAIFCQKCGTKIQYTGMSEESPDTSKKHENVDAAEALQQNAAVAPARAKTSQASKASSNTTGKKRYVKLPITIGAAALVIIAVIVIAVNWNGKIDYAATVGAHTPFAVSQGIPYTYEEVLNKYIVSPEWEVSKDGDVRYVDISGTLKGKDNELVITIKLSPDPNNSDSILIAPESVKLDDVESSTQDEAVRFLYNLFCVYDEGYNDLSWLNTDLAGTQGKAEFAAINNAFYAEYEEAAKVILLDWFDRHPLVHDVVLQFKDEVVDAEDGSGRYLLYEMYLDQGEYGALYVNPDNGDMIMDSVINGYGSWSSIQVPMDQWYLEYYWGWTDDSGYYSEFYRDDLYIVYNEMGYEILEYYSESDAYSICDCDITYSVEVIMDSYSAAAGEPDKEGYTEETQDLDYKTAYAEKVRELAADDDTLLFALIDLTGNDVPELVAEHFGYYVSVFTWEDGAIITLMDQWAYGAGGNMGYEYLPGCNVIRNFNNDHAGAIVYESYMTVNDACEIVSLYDDELSIWHIRDSNGNGHIDEDEEYSEEPIYYYGSTEVSAEVYATYQITGDFERISGDTSAEEILVQLNAVN